MPLESTIVKGILKFLNDLPGCAAEKVSGTSSSSGKADINGCYHGRMFRLEIKTPDHGNKASLKQEINLMRWEAAGAICAVCFNLTEVKKALGIKEQK